MYLHKNTLAVYWFISLFLFVIHMKVTLISAGQRIYEFHCNNECFGAHFRFLKILMYAVNNKKLKIKILET